MTALIVIAAIISIAAAIAGAVTFWMYPGEVAIYIPPNPR